MDLDMLTDEPQFFPDCCVGVSKPLVHCLLAKLPSEHDPVLSIGSGSGFLEAALFQSSGGKLNLYGVEVSQCENVYLPADRALQVPSTHSLHPDAMLATVLMFVYPRQPDLIVSYIKAFIDGALEKVIWLGHRSDWPDGKAALSRGFDDIETIEGPGIAPYELLAVATRPRTIPASLG